MMIVVSEIEAARTRNPTEYLVAVGNNCPDGWQDFHEGTPLKNFCAS